MIGAKKKIPAIDKQPQADRVSDRDSTATGRAKRLFQRAIYLGSSSTE